MKKEAGMKNEKILIVIVSVLLGVGLAYYTGVGDTLESRAKKGDVVAMHELGLRFERGAGVERDVNKAVELYHKAAEKGYARSQFNLGIAYSQGLGVKRDTKQAAEWYIKSAEQGFTLAEHNLGTMYLSGSNGVYQDPAKAVDYLTRAADKHYPLSLHALGILYMSGAGVAQDMDKGMELLRASANAGVKNAPETLSGYYLAQAMQNGRATDMAEAYYWLLIHQRLNNTGSMEVSKYMDLVEQNLRYLGHPEYIQEMQDLANQWKPKSKWKRDW